MLQSVVEINVKDELVRQFKVLCLSEEFKYDRRDFDASFESVPPEELELTDRFDASIEKCPACGTQAGPHVFIERLPYVSCPKGRLRTSSPAIGFSFLVLKLDGNLIPSASHCTEKMIAICSNIQKTADRVKPSASILTWSAAV